MPVQLFTEGIEPDDPDAIIWRFMELWKFRDLVQTRRLYLRRSDKLDDAHECLPPDEFARASLGLDRYDIHDIHKLNHDLGTTAQFRQAFYVNCWYLFDHETAGMWAKFGQDGVAIVSRYSLLKSALHPLPDRLHLGCVRYGWEPGTRWNLLRFITTKREEYASEREVRAMLWKLDSGDGVNRHIDIDNRVHRLPVYAPPETLPAGITVPVDVRALITEIVLTPQATPTLLGDVQSLARSANLEVTVRPSALTKYAGMIPTAEELKRLGL